MDDTRITSTSCEKRIHYMLNGKQFQSPVFLMTRTVKQRFKSCEKNILKQIRIAKSNYFNRIFTAYLTDMRKHGALLMKP